MNWLLRAAVAIAGLALAAALAVALVQLPPPAAVRLPDLVAMNLEQSGVAHPVTAVLLNFRGYDTLLEVAVLLVALLTLLTLNEGGAPAPAGASDPLLQGLASKALPLMLLTAGYLLWAGAHRPGGAFQAGAVLAAGAVLLQLAGLLPAWTAPRRLLRLGLVLGFLVFLGVAAVLLGEGAMLLYPPALAGSLILLIEASLTLSLGLILAGLFLFVTGRRP